MTKTISNSIGVCALVLAGSCSVADDGSHRIAVTESNTLGVATLTTTHVADNGNDVFTLLGLSANGQELASVRLTVGIIPDLANVTDGHDDGSEIVIAVTGTHDTRILTRETQLFKVRTSSAHPEMAEFLGLSEVSTTLEREANIIVVRTDVVPATEVADTAGGCATSYLLTSPTATQCCYTTPYEQNPGYYMYFVRTSDNTVVERDRNPFGTHQGCQSASGGSCSGAACFYGPLGFSAASFIYDGTTPVITSVMSDNGSPYTLLCDYARSGTKTYGNTNGNGARNQGCPGSDGGGGNGKFDY